MKDDQIIQRYIEHRKVIFMNVNEVLEECIFNAYSTKPIDLDQFAHDANVMYSSLGYSTPAIYSRACVCNINIANYGNVHISINILEEIKSHIMFLRELHGRKYDLDYLFYDLLGQHHSIANFAYYDAFSKPCLIGQTNIFITFYLKLFNRFNIEVPKYMKKVLDMSYNSFGIMFYTDAVVAIDKPCKFCISNAGSMMPERPQADDNPLLHSMKGPAMEWKNGCDVYAINGKIFQNQLKFNEAKMEILLK